MVLSYKVNGVYDLYYYYYLLFLLLLLLLLLYTIQMPVPHELYDRHLTTLLHFI